MEGLLSKAPECGSGWLPAADAGTWGERGAGGVGEGSGCRTGLGTGLLAPGRCLEPWRRLSEAGSQALPAGSRRLLDPAFRGVPVSSSAAGSGESPALAAPGAVLPGPRSQAAA